MMFTVLVAYGPAMYSRKLFHLYSNGEARSPLARNSRALLAIGQNSAKGAW